MPHLDGEACFRELRQLKPDVRVLMSSGYNEQDVVNRFAGKGLFGFIQKPYTFAQLIAKVRKVMGD
jgi:DNA-binding NtrC family response regulator